jgi:2-dehydro-3-deoxygluconokinase
VKKVFCFGELLFRISPAANDAIAYNPMLLYVGGAEANVATALAGWNVPVKYCTALPDNFMSRHVLHYLEYKGIYTSSILFAGNRIGVYYLERGADLKGKMAYDREGSSFSQLQRGMIDWDKVFQDVCWFHFTAISPALNANVADVCLEAVEVAHRKGIKISIDLNYRSRLWKWGKEPVDVIPNLVQYCDVVMGNIWAANTMLGTSIDEQIHDNASREKYLAHAKKTSVEIMEQFPKCKVVANTFRFDSEKNDVLYYTSLYANSQQYNSQSFTCQGVVDRSGSGDCFMAGLIYGLYNNLSPQDVVDYATAAAFGKLQEQGDATGQDVLTVSEKQRTASSIPSEKGE